MTAEREAWIFLNHVRSLGPGRFHRLLHHTQSALEILKMTSPDFVAAGASQEQAETWRHAIDDPDMHRMTQEEQNRAEKGEFRIITELDETYPEALRELSGRPFVLYIKGLWPLPGDVSLGLVGTRRPSPYGIRVAEELTAELCQRGVVTVSGLAVGIDRVVHETTINKEGLTVAALGHGFGHRYPKQNKDLFESISVKGTLVTEFPYNIAPEAIHFPRRNRIISGLSKGVVVIEAGSRSGALITARYAAEQGKDVFAVPGSIFQSGSVGCHRLLKQGAKLVETVDDILEEFEGFSRSPSQASVPEEPRTAGHLQRVADLSAFEKQILQHLSAGPLSVDELTAAMRNSVDLLAGALLSLELKDWIINLPGQRYGLKNS